MTGGKKCRKYLLDVVCAKQSMQSKNESTQNGRTREKKLSRAKHLMTKLLTYRLADLLGFNQQVLKQIRSL